MIALRRGQTCGALLIDPVRGVEDAVAAERHDEEQHAPIPGPGVAVREDVPSARLDAFGNLYQKCF